MTPRKLPNADASVVSVTTSAATLEDLIATAASAAFTFDPQDNAVYLYNEGSNAVRILWDGNTPTASKGIELNSDTSLYLAGLPLDQIQMISTSGTVLVGVQVGRVVGNEVSFINAA